MQAKPDNVDDQASCYGQQTYTSYANSWSFNSRGSPNGYEHRDMTINRPDRQTDLGYIIHTLVLLLLLLVLLALGLFLAASASGICTSSFSSVPSVPSSFSSLFGGGLNGNKETDGTEIV